MTDKLITRWLMRLLCAIGWHRQIGVTVGGFVRCYACSRNLHPQDNVWRIEMPPDLRPSHEADADELRRVLEDLTLVWWNDDYPPCPEFDAALLALGYRRDGDVWVRP